MVTFFDRRSGNIVGFSVKIMLSGCEKIDMKLKEADALILPEGELFKIFGSICNIVIKVSILCEAKITSGRSHKKRNEI